MQLDKNYCWQSIIVLISKFKDTKKPENLIL